MDEPQDDGLDEPAETVCGIVRLAAPEQTILFGSVARGEAGPNSDLDLLVNTASSIHRPCWRVGTTLRDRG